jgi:hypothetical protein
MTNIRRDDKKANAHAHGGSNNPKYEGAHPRVPQVIL